MNRRRTAEVMTAGNFVNVVGRITAFFAFSLVLFRVIDFASISTGNLTSIFWAGLSVSCYLFFAISTLMLLIPRGAQKLVDLRTNLVFISISWTIIILNFVAASLYGLGSIPEGVIYKGTMNAILIYTGIGFLLAIICSIIIHFYLRRVRTLRERLKQLVRPVAMLNFWLRIKECFVQITRPTDSVKTEGHIVRCLDVLFRYIKLFSPLEWCLGFCGYKKAVINVEEAIKAAQKVEKYVILWVSIEVIALLVLWLFSSFREMQWFTYVLIFLLSLRLIDMFQGSMNAAFMNPQRFCVENDGYGLINRRRFLFMNLINFAELIIIFAVLSFLAVGVSVGGYSSIVDSLVYSTKVATLLGADLQLRVVSGYILFFSEIFFAFTYIILILSRAVSILK